MSFKKHITILIFITVCGNAQTDKSYLNNYPFNENPIIKIVSFTDLKSTDMKWKYMGCISVPMLENY